MKRFLYTLLFMVAGTFLLLAPQSVSAETVITDYEILQQFCQIQNLDIENYSVIYRTELTLPLSGITGERAKIIDNNLTMQRSI